MKKTVIVSYLLVLVWMAIIFLLSNEVAATSSGRSAVIVQAIHAIVGWPESLLTFMTRKAAHIVAYFVLGFLLYNLVRMYRQRVRQVAALSIGVASIYAIFDEVHQTFIPGRSGEIRDVVIDSMAAIAGVAVYYLLFVRFLRRKIG